MLFKESVTIALKALFSNKLRSILTMLGIIIGVAAVIAMVSLGMGVRKNVQNSIASLGSNMLIATTWRQREEMRRIGQSNADRRWEVLPQQPALAYDIAQNRLIATAAVLQPPVFDPAATTAAKFGSFGALVGQAMKATKGKANPAQVNELLKKKLAG